MVNMILTNSRGTPVVRRSASERIALLAEKKRLIAGYKSTGLPKPETSTLDVTELA